VVHGATANLRSTPLTWSVTVVLAGLGSFSKPLRVAEDD
jgi:hypothetical protein